MLDVSSVMLGGRRALVTGAGQGIGEAIALGLAAFGADVAALDLDGDKASRTAARVREQGRRAAAVDVDVREAARLERALERAADELGGADILVNNAGGGRFKPSLHMEDAEFDEQIALNLKSAFVGSRWASRRWIAAECGGSIVNVATTEGIRGCTGLAPYAAAKAGVINLTKTLSSELGPYGIRVNAIAPDYTPTPGLDRYDLEGNTPAQRMERTRRFIPLRRLGSPDDMAGAVVFLASDLAAWITGQTLVVDGGSLACARVEGPFPFPKLR